LVRLIQGICIGGEYSGTMIYLAETAPTDKKAFFTSFSATGANAGFFLGIGMTALLEHFLTKNQMQFFGWRIAFLIGGLLAIVIIYLRRFLTETPIFDNLKNEKRISNNPLKDSLKNDYLLIFKIIAIVSFGATLYYITFTYLSAYLVQYNHFKLHNITTIETFLIGSMFILVPIFSLICDRFGKKIMYYIFCTLAIIASYFIFYYFQFGSKNSVLFGLAFLTILSSMEQATTLITVVELLPVSVRYTSLAIGYIFGNALFGGLTPFLITEFTKITNNAYIPAFYLITTAILTITTVYFSKLSPELDQEVIK
jgi:MHS family proline/betaine transporter-like MFS transporter